jgi:CubicO group peptidase (beta-lactamase class C family)
VIESATGHSVEDCIRDLVLTPLGMRATGFRYQRERRRAVGYVRLNPAFRPLLRTFLPRGLLGPRTGSYTSFHPFLVNGAGYGGLIGPATDAARLAAMHAAAVDDPHPVLDQHDIELMRTVGTSGKPFDHGIGWFRRPRDAHRTPPFVEHYGTGGGYWNAMRVYPDSRLAIVAMANTTAEWNVNRLFTDIEALSWT